MQGQSTIKRVYSNGFCVEGYITAIISITLRQLLGVEFSKDGEAMHGQEALHFTAIGCVWMDIFTAVISITWRQQHGVQFTSTNQMMISS
jgi:hypothetical protein